MLYEAIYGSGVFLLGFTAAKLSSWWRREKIKEQRYTDAVNSALSNGAGVAAFFMPATVMKDPEFIECDACRAKPGSPLLCRGCLHNRSAILQLSRELRAS